MKFKLCKGLILIPVVFQYRAEKIETQALVDTGSGGSALDIELVRFDFSLPTKAREIVGVGGIQEVAIQEIESISLCGTKVLKFPIEFGDIATSFGFKAVIGSDLLNLLGTCIDYQQQEIRISTFTDE